MSSSTMAVTPIPPSPHAVLFSANGMTALKDWQVTAWQHLGLPEPTIQVDTGGKSIHSYWIFDEPIPLINGVPFKNASLNTLMLIAALKIPSRVMRLPGTHHISPDGTSGGLAAIIHQTDHYYTLSSLTNACLMSRSTITS
jgi:hypothetical protein